MLFRYLKLSLRLLVRNPYFTMVNLLGLSVGFGSFFILWEFASAELKADQYHSDFERIARLGIYWRWPTQDGKSGLLTFGSIRPHQAPRIAQDLPQIEQYVRLLKQPEFTPELVGHLKRVVVSVGREDGGKYLFEETRMVYADSNLFSFFSIPLIRGEKHNVLKEAHSVVLSERTARKYFGREDPVGEQILVNDSVLLIVTGVFEDLPYNTHLAFDLVVSMTGIPVNDFPYLMATTYIKVDNQTTFQEVTEAINGKYSEYWSSELRRFPVFRPEVFAQPLPDIAFSPAYERDYLMPKPKSALVLMRFASLFILAMAWINYINLTASRMLKRIKEVATRKVTGALPADFIRQFVTESFLMNTLAVAVALTLVQLALVTFRELFNIHNPEFSELSYGTWSVFGLVSLSGILLSGLYPAVIAASYDPRALVSLSRKAGPNRIVQSWLSASQYVIALVLLLWVFIVYLQLNFILDKDIGIQRDQVVIIDAPIVKTEQYLLDLEAFLGQLRSLTGVEAATYSATVIGDTDPFFVWVKGPTQPGFTSASSNGGVDESYIPFYGIPILAGRNFVANDKPDVVLLSRQATKRLGFGSPEEAVGQKISLDELEPILVEVVGVIEDYRIKPLFNLASTATENNEGWGICLQYKNGIYAWRVPERIALRIDWGRRREIMPQAEKLFRAAFEGNVFNWYLLDDHINKAYGNDRIARNQIALFAGIAIGLSCLGLLGMMTTLAEEKIKEIGIRKVLGAGAWQIGQRLIRAVFVPVVPAIVLAVPVAYYLADQFLDRYLERIPLHWWHFAAPVLILLVLLLGTIASLLLKSAKSNPVEALKYE